VTFCTHDRLKLFNSDERVECVRQQILRTCDERRFAIPAGVFMPDHLHLLVRALDKGSPFISCMTLARSRSALTYRRTFGTDLWQDGYVDHVVRDADDERRVTRYIRDNPVEARLCVRPEDFVVARTSNGSHRRSQRGTLVPHHSLSNNPTIKWGTRRGGRGPRRAYNDSNSLCDPSLSSS
jgi:REP element-mobilizing transposase RayT